MVVIFSGVRVIHCDAVNDDDFAVVFKEDEDQEHEINYTAAVLEYKVQVRLDRIPK